MELPWGCKCKRFTDGKTKKFDLEKLGINPESYQIGVGGVKYESIPHTFSDALILLDMIQYNRCLIYQEAIKRNRNPELLKNYDKLHDDLLQIVKEHMKLTDEDKMLADATPILIMRTMPLEKNNSNIAITMYEREWLKKYKNKLFEILSSEEIKKELGEHYNDFQKTFMNNIDLI